jgi:hypothetical protein
MIGLWLGRKGVIMTHSNLVCNGGIYYPAEGTVLTVLTETTDVSIFKNRIPAGKYTAGRIELATLTGYLFIELIPESGAALRVCIGKIGTMFSAPEQLNWEDSEVFTF